jgi:hypothetical protein
MGGPVGEITVLKELLGLMMPSTALPWPKGGQ